MEEAWWTGVCGMQKSMVLLVIGKVQCGWMVDQLHSCAFGCDLGVEHTLASSLTTIGGLV